MIRDNCYPNKDIYLKSSQANIWKQNVKTNTNKLKHRDHVKKIWVKMISVILFGNLIQHRGIKKS